jgi:hypothetical protein
MTARVQVVVDEEERERFRQQAGTEGLSLSAWLREAGRRRLHEKQNPRELKTVEQLDAFFVECRSREEGQEPDWEEHLAVIEGSVRSGAADT